MSEKVVVQPTVTLLEIPSEQGDLVFVDASTLLQSTDDNRTEIDGVATQLVFVAPDGGSLEVTEVPCILQVDDPSDDVSITQEQTRLEVGDNLSEVVFTGATSPLSVIERDDGVAISVGAESLTIEEPENDGLVAREIRVEIIDVGGPGSTGPQGPAGPPIFLEADSAGSDEPCMGPAAPHGATHGRGLSDPIRTVTKVLVDAPTIEVDAAHADTFRVTIAGDRMLNLTSPFPGLEFILMITQDAVGGRFIDWGANTRFELGVAPVLSVGANRTDVFRLLDAADGVHWLVFTSAIGYQ